MNVSSTEGGKVKIDDFIAIEYPDISIIDKGTLVTLEAIPQEGYTFIGWTGSNATKQNPVTIEMDCTKNILANFSITTHNLSIGIEGQGSVFPPAGNYDYIEGTIVNISATPDTGCQFDGWTGGVNNENADSTSITMNQDKSIIANFSCSAHTLTIEIQGEGTVTPSPGANSYNKDTSVEITAIPDDGYKFDGWTGDVENISKAKTSVKMDSDKTIIANFLERTYTLTMGHNGAGSVTPPVGVYQYGEGTIVDVIATPDEGYQFGYWTGGVINSNSASTTLTITSDTTIRANFSKKGISTGILVGIILGVIVILGLVIWVFTRRFST
ncbi:MAG: InlB B-repeat-containing protein [Dehalococcoidales bacterium]|nr:InlB B-repeat-containing protein [Dehalococcoidales bacterium]